MMNVKPSTPFPLTGYYGPSYFCDREKETEAIISSLEGGRNKTLFSVRRLGKTALIRHVFHSLEQTGKWKCIYMDLFPTTGLKQLTETLATAVLQAFPQNESRGKKIWKAIQSLRPVIAYDPVTGSPEISFYQAQQANRSTLQSLFTLLEEQKVRIAVAFDEFQQITNYKEENIEALLRSFIQHCRNINFIFSGSEQHLLTDIFSNSRRPFYQSTELLNLKKIDRNLYGEFIVRKLKEHNRSVEEGALDLVLSWTRSHTFYTQTLMNRVFLSGKKKISEDLVYAEIFKILKEQEAHFYSYRRILTEGQWKLLTAIAKEEEVFEPTASAFVLGYNLGTPAHVRRGLQSLLEKDLISRLPDDDGKLYYQVNDVFLSRWLERLKM